MSRVSKVLAKSVQQREGQSWTFKKAEMQGIDCKATRSLDQAFQESGQLWLPLKLWSVHVSFSNRWNMLKNMFKKCQDPLHHQFVALCRLEAQWNRSENLDGSTCWELTAKAWMNQIFAQFKETQGFARRKLEKGQVSSHPRLVKDMSFMDLMGMCKTGVAKCAKSFSLCNAKSTFLYRWGIGLEAPELSPANDLRETATRWQHNLHHRHVCLRVPQHKYTSSTYCHDRLCKSKICSHIFCGLV